VVKELWCHATQHADVCCSFKIFTLSIKKPFQLQVRIDCALSKGVLIAQEPCKSFLLFDSGFLQGVVYEQNVNFHF
jgi:hypothetical protein